MHEVRPLESGHKYYLAVGHFATDIRSNAKDAGKPVGQDQVDRFWARLLRRLEAMPWDATMPNGGTVPGGAWIRLEVVGTTPCAQLADAARAGGIDLSLLSPDQRVSMSFRYDLVYATKGGRTISLVDGRRFDAAVRHLALDLQAPPWQRRSAERPSTGGRVARALPTERNVGLL